ncbi:zinc finger and SCAN domain-containing protein 25 [Anopheles funestus]|uniref:C2H2-type domain-containing protein n=1 Tax=Anopheles funestus TaxID=62324 RepID=A0A182RYP6_ANOFN|nr:zinc finger and SCAN domain-containing protein 25 [Anopheles funestus]
MNFSAFGGPFSGIHQFAAKFGSNDGAFTSTNSPGNGTAAATNGVGLGAATGNGVGGVATAGSNIGQQQDLNRYHGATNGNHFNQNTTSMVNTPMSYGQNMSHPYGGANQQTTNDHTFGNGTASMGNDHQTKVTKGGNVLKVDRDDMINQQILQNVNQSWQTLTNPSNTVDYSSHLLSATLPISIQHLLKYSETIKKEPNSGSVAGSGLNSPGPLSGLIGVETNAFNVQKDLLNLKNGSNLNLALGNVAVSAAAASLGLNHQHLMQHHQQQQQQHAANASHHTDNGFVNQQQHANSMTNGAGQTVVSSDAHNSSSSTLNGGTGANGEEANGVGSTPATGTGTGKTKTKKQKKRKPPKEKKPRPKPGQIRETKALDGSPLFCCPECQMAYPERGLIEQHVISHAVERRFVCDICNAALKRKDHLTRHKLSHIPDRPHICSICLKSFKRKEQLTLHIVIHTGEKKHICGECGKGFYRKDHLRKHTRSHIARRVKSEMSASNGTGSGSGSANVTAAQNNSTLAGSLMATNMQGAPVTAS